MSCAGRTPHFREPRPLAPLERMASAAAVGSSDGGFTPKEDQRDGEDREDDVCRVRMAMLSTGRRRLVARRAMS